MPPQFFKTNGRYAPPEATGPTRNRAGALIADPTQFVIVEPKYDAGGLIYMPLSYPDYPPDGGRPTRVLPDRYEDGTGNWTPFMASVPGVHKTGPGGTVTMIFDQPPDGPNFKSAMENPYDLVIGACKMARNQTIETPFGSSAQHNWSGLLESADSVAKFAQRNPGLAQNIKPAGKYATLKPSGTLHFQFGIVFRVGEQVYGQNGVPPRGVTPGDPIPVILLPKQGFEGFREAMYAPPTDNSDEPYLIKQMTGVKYLNIYSKKDGSKMQHNQKMYQYQKSQARTGMGGGPIPIQTGVQEVGYGLYVGDTPDGTPNTQSVPKSVPDGISISRLKKWEDVLVWTSLKDVAAQTCAMGLPDGLIWYAFRNHPEYYPSGFSNRAMAVEARGSQNVTIGNWGGGTSCPQVAPEPVSHVSWAPPTSSEWPALHTTGQAAPAATGAPWGDETPVAAPSANGWGAAPSQPSTPWGAAAAARQAAPPQSTAPLYGSGMATPPTAEAVLTPPAATNDPASQVSQAKYDDYQKQIQEALARANQESNARLKAPGK